MQLIPYYLALLVIMSLHSIPELESESQSSGEEVTFIYETQPLSTKVPRMNQMPLLCAIAPGSPANDLVDGLYTIYTNFLPV